MSGEKQAASVEVEARLREELADLRNAVTPVVFLLERLIEAWQSEDEDGLVEAMRDAEAVLARLKRSVR